MANRRMFSKDVIQSDEFYDLPHESQLLYFILGMEADDEGFIGSSKRICRAYGLDNKALPALVENGLIVQLESGVIWIRHWRTNNQIRADRFKETNFKTEREQILKMFGFHDGNQMETSGKPSTGQDRTEQDRTESVSGSGSGGLGGSVASMTDEEYLDYMHKTYTPKVLNDMCQKEHIKLNEVDVLQFICKVKQDGWKWSDNRIEPDNMGKVLRAYQKNKPKMTKDQAEKLAKQGGLLGYDD